MTTFKCLRFITDAHPAGFGVLSVKVRVYMRVYVSLFVCACMHAMLTSLQWTSGSGGHNCVRYKVHGCVGMGFEVSVLF